MEVPKLLQESYLGKVKLIFIDSSFQDSPAKINVEEIFKLLAPDTRVKVI